MPRLVLHLQSGDYAVCRLDPAGPVPPWAGSVDFSSVTRTAEELSIICPAGQVPAEVKAERGWRLFKLAGPLDFGAVGILAAVAAPLAKSGISLLSVATFDTDYVLVKTGQLADGIRALEAAGHAVGGN